jgi:DNA-binding transcriptional MerR regulator
MDPTPPPPTPPDAPGPPAAPVDARLRIDDLARETGLTVDTLRYYQREGLLPPGEREGRHRTYGTEHVRRIKKIKELQGRRFSIAAIRAMVTGEGDRLAGIFVDGGEDVRLTLDELLERSGADPDLAGTLQVAGVLRDPLDFGRTAYDGDDLDMLRAMATLRRLGIPTDALRAFGEIYADGIESTQQRIVDVFVSGEPAGLTPDALRDLQQTAARNSVEMLESMRHLVSYTHHRTIQRLALDAVQAGHLPVGDPDATDPALALPTDSDAT